MEVPGNTDILIPGSGRVKPGTVEQVGAIVDHLEIAIQRDGIDAILVDGTEIAEKRDNIIPLECRIRLNARSQVFKILLAGIIDHPLRSKDKDIILLCLVLHIRQDSLVQFRKGDGAYRDLSTGTVRKFLRTPLEWLGNLWSCEG